MKQSTETNREERTTQDRLLDAAEKLFVEKGFASTSVRMIASEAGVNLAAMHYHFGSKHGLVQAVFGRRIGPVNQERIRLLEQLLQKTDGSPELPDLLRVFLTPPLKMMRTVSGQRVMQLFGRVFTEPDQELQDLFLSQFRQIADTFVPVFQRCLPGLSDEEFFWRLHFTLGAMAHTMAQARTLEALSRGRCNIRNTDEVIDRLIRYSVGGLTAAETRQEGPA